MKSITMKRFLKVVSSISLRHIMLNPLLETRGLEAKCTKEVISKFKRWEHMPNRREPVPMKMVLHTHKKCKNMHPDSLEFVLCD